MLFPDFGRDKTNTQFEFFMADMEKFANESKPEFPEVSVKEFFK